MRFRNSLRTILTVVIAILIIGSCQVTATFAASCPSGGDHEYRITIIKHATENASGTEQLTCTKCSHSYTRTIAKLGHNFGSWTVKLSPTCMNEGLEYKKCSGCGVTKQRVIPATGVHNYKDTSSKGDCTHDGVQQKACTSCGKSHTVTTKASGHKYKVRTTEVAGQYQVITYACSVCGNEKVTRKPMGSEDPKEEVVVEEQDPEEEPKEEMQAVEPLEQTLIEADPEEQILSAGPNTADVVLSVFNVGSLAILAFLIASDLYVISWYRRERRAYENGEYEDDDYSI